MEIPWHSIVFYCAFGIFVYYQRLYAQASVDDGWQKLFLTGLAFAGMVTGFVYLAYCGWTLAWWVPVIALAMSTLAAIPAILVERVWGRMALGRVSVPAWPLCAYMMFQTLPA